MRRDNGFSLVELMVAMTITLIVSGAIYGLLASGGNAFRREPEVADRQQNIRMAMDLITRDVFNAGAALPTFAQAFTVADAPGGACTGAQGLNGCGIAGSLGSAAASARAPGDGGDVSTNTDVLEIVAAADPCPPETVCSGGISGVRPGDAGRFVTRGQIPACLALPGPVIITDNEGFTIQAAVPASGGTEECDSGGSSGVNGNIDLLAVLQPWAWPAPGPAPTPHPSLPPPATPVIFLYGAQITRYRIGPSTDPMDTSPALWRSATGVYDTAGNVQLEPGAPGFSLGGGSPWELVARGIEDLQVEYMAGDGLWRNQPPPVVTTPPAGWATLVRRVRITLSARVTAANLQGETMAGGAGPDAVRGQLVTEVAPRAAFHELQMGSQIQ